MAVEIRSNGLHHAVSLGTIEVSLNDNNSTPTHFDRNYDSEDENMSRRRLRHTASTELHPRTSVYSKGDIREQYCLTDRQLNSIERPRRSERFFGCLSRRSGTPPSFLGVCVGRRAPSDENLAAYAPFYKPPRYSQRQLMHGYGDKGMETDMGTSYFRRQPASILSTSKIVDGGSAIAGVGIEPVVPSTTEEIGDDIGHRNVGTGVWMGSSVMQGNKSSYHCPQQQPMHMSSTPAAPITPRTKHVSFARSHTLTSFDDVQLGLRTTARMKVARSQERLIGGKKPSVYESVSIGGTNHTMPHLYHASGMRLPTITSQTQQQGHTFLASGLHHQHPVTLSHAHDTSAVVAYSQDHGHGHQHATMHMHPYMGTTTSIYNTERGQTEQPLADGESTMGIPGVLLCSSGAHQHFPHPNPEVVIVEKKFRNAMKTQATQTEMRKNGTTAHMIALSPRTIHKVRVVSQGAQTNGGIGNGKKELAKSLSEMPNSNLDLKTCLAINDISGEMDANDHELLQRTQSEEPPRSPLDVLQVDNLEGHSTIKYYKPPPPLLATSPNTAILRRSSQAINAMDDARRRSTHFPEGDYDFEMVLAPPPFDYVSNSLPRRTCSYNRTENEYSSNSLPRSSESSTLSAVPHDICKHITDCTDLLNHAHSSPTIDFTSTHLLPPPQQYCHEEHEIEQKDVQNNNKFDAEQKQITSTKIAYQYNKEQLASSNRRMSMMESLPTRQQQLQDKAPSKLNSPNMNSFRRDDIRRQSMPIYVKTEKLIDGYAPRSSLRSSFRSTNERSQFQQYERVNSLMDEQEIFIDFKPHISQKANSQHQTKINYSGPLLLPIGPLSKRVNAGVRDNQNHNGDEEEECNSYESIERDGESGSGSIAGEEEDDEYNENDNDNVEEDEDDDLKSDEVDVSKKKDLVKSEFDDANGNDRLYENIIPKHSSEQLTQVQSDDYNKRSIENFWKRSISLDDPAAGDDEVQNTFLVKSGVSAPPSPYRDELLANASTYPSSDSLTNDVTRDHSDGLWNESQVTVLPATDQKDISEGSLSSNLLLTPTAKRKNLILQHQQRSSIDTDALELEEQIVDTSPTYSNVPAKIPYKPTLKDIKSLNKPLIAPSIAVTPSISAPTNQDFKYNTISPKRSPSHTTTSSRNYALASHEAVNKSELNKSFEINNTYGQRLINTDISECSTTNTDEYATCTDNSKRTPGIKTPLTATSSSSTTQVPVSTQSSQMDKTHCGSSFESASSLYSTRGELLPDESQIDLKRSTMETSEIPEQASKKSPSHSVSSTSSGSYNVAGGIGQIKSQSKCPQQQQLNKDVSTTTANAFTTSNTSTVEQSIESQIRAKTKIKPESVSDDERSEVCYSSSGYYESPREEDQQEQQVAKTRRHILYHHRIDEERKKRKCAMKLDIEKENMRALTSPIKRPFTTTAAVIAPNTLNKVFKEPSPEQQKVIDKTIDDATSTLGVAVNATTSNSLNKIKRFRPKIRRQFRKSSRDDITTRHQKAIGNNFVSKNVDGSVPKQFTCDGIENDIEEKEEKNASALIPNVKPQSVISLNLGIQQKETEMKNKSITSPQTSKSLPDGCQLQAKSVESLRSVSPGSDSVFYSEADGNEGEQQSHCLQCAKDAEGASHSIVATVCGDSVESLPYMEHETELDIVKPPSDFADSPITIKTTHRLYKKMDKRFRSEERYHGGERGRHYKNRQENIRAKSEERSRDSLPGNSTCALRAAGSSPCVLPDTNSEQSQHIIYRGHYDVGRYTRLTDADVWTQLNHQNFDRRDRESDRRASTDSEHSFRSKYQVILHRLVQRRCTLEMYHRQNNNTFQLISPSSGTDTLRRKLQEIVKLMLLVYSREGYLITRITGGKCGVDKTIVVKSDSGEFGFRIHGSKPVVVAAIEPETPAESSGLEVGDIIICVNGVQVLDKHHTEVVKIAHDGCEKLELQVARTIGILMSEDQEPNCQPIYSGFLWRQRGQAKGAPNTKKWVRRWFCLRPDNCLYYYKTESDTQPVGAMILVNHVVEHCPPDIGKPYAFKVDSGEGIPLYMAADSEELANRWFKLLKQSATQSNSWLNKCSQNLYQQPTSILKPDCFGYLLKLGSRWCGWSKRYCVLKDACLYFYQDANSKSAFGMACLHGYKVASMSTNAAGKKNAFEIIPPEAKLRHYYFSTESEMDKKRWISALEYSIDRWIKSG